MSAKKRMPKRAQQPLPGGWHRKDSFQWNGRHIEPGTEVSIRGERGRFRFVSHTTVVGERSGEVILEWVDVIGGARGASQWRSFRPDRIRRVHRLRKTMTAAEARDLVNKKNREKREAA